MSEEIIMSSTYRRNYMKALKIFIFSVLFASIAQAQVGCETVPSASCLGKDGMCFDFFNSEYSDPEAWEGLCEESEGTMSESPCEVSKTVVKCLVLNNPLMPVIHFLNDFSQDEATQACVMMQGKVCH